MRTIATGPVANFSWCTFRNFFFIIDFHRNWGGHPNFTGGFGAKVWPHQLFSIFRVTAPVFKQGVFFLVPISFWKKFFTSKKNSEKKFLGKNFCATRKFWPDIEKSGQLLNSRKSTHTTKIGEFTESATWTDFRSLVGALARFAHPAAWDDDQVRRGVVGQNFPDHEIFSDRKFFLTSKIRPLTKIDHDRSGEKIFYKKKSGEKKWRSPKSSDTFSKFEIRRQRKNFSRKKSGGNFCQVAVRDDELDVADEIFVEKFSLSAFRLGLGRLKRGFRCELVLVSN